jgi:mRNA-degrading endonuclease RelE of RelBE toxin-antitoxin system
VSLTVIFRETALRSMARIRSDDADAFVRARAAIGGLVHEPHPDGAVAWGATGIYRLHAGEIRVLYEVDDEASAIYIINVGLVG